MGFVAQVVAQLQGGRCDGVLVILSRSNLKVIDLAFVTHASGKQRDKGDISSNGYLNTGKAR